MFIFVLCFQMYLLVIMGLKWLIYLLYQSKNVKQTRYSKMRSDLPCKSHPPAHTKIVSDNIMSPLTYNRLFVADAEQVHTSDFPNQIKYCMLRACANMEAA